MCGWSSGQFAVRVVIELGVAGGAGSDGGVRCYESGRPCRRRRLTVDTAPGNGNEFVVSRDDHPVEASCRRAHLKDFLLEDSRDYPTSRKT